MSFRLALVDGETSVTRKLIAKAVRFLAEAPERGEMHEIKTLFEAQDGRLLLDNGTVCSLPALGGQQYFTRMGWRCRKLGDVTVSSLQRVLCLEKTSMVYAGSHEVDALLEHAPGGHAKVLLECKSGNARSAGAQTNAYLECLLKESRPGRTQHYFAYSADESGPVHIPEYWPFFFRVFKGIANIGCVQGTPGTATAARPFFSRINFDRTGQTLDALNDALDIGVRDGILPQNPENPAAKVDALNDLLYAKAGIRLVLFNAKRSSPAGIATMARKAAQEESKKAPSAESTFWDGLIQWLRDREKG
jgi:hypothetical protein